MSNVQIGCKPGTNQVQIVCKLDANCLKCIKLNKTNFVFGLWSKTNTDIRLNLSDMHQTKRYNFDVKSVKLTPIQGNGLFHRNSFKETAKMMS